MKKFIIVMITVFATVGAYAQFNKGRMLIGGSLGFNITTNKTKTGGTTVTNYTTTSFSFAPQFGYFIVNNLALGVAVDGTITNTRPKEQGASDFSSNSLEFQPFVRYYLKPGIFFQGQFGLGARWTQYSNSSNVIKTALSGVSIAAGYALFINRNVAIEPMMGYAVTYEKYKDSSPVERVSDGGLFLRVGFQIYLRK